MEKKAERSSIYEVEPNFEEHLSEVMKNFSNLGDQKKLNLLLCVWRVINYLNNEPAEQTKINNLISYDKLNDLYQKEKHTNYNKELFCKLLKDEMLCHMKQEFQDKYNEKLNSLHKNDSRNKENEMISFLEEEQKIKILSTIGTITPILSRINEEIGRNRDLPLCSPIKFKHQIVTSKGENSLIFEKDNNSILKITTNNIINFLEKIAKSQNKAMKIHDNDYNYYNDNNSAIKFRCKKDVLLILLKR